MTTMIDTAKNLTAASELARRLFDENRRLRAEINRLRALHEATTADVEIVHGRQFRLVEKEEGR